MQSGLGSNPWLNGVACCRCRGHRDQVFDGTGERACEERSSAARSRGPLREGAGSYLNGPAVHAGEADVLPAERDDVGKERGYSLAYFQRYTLS